MNQSIRLSENISYAALSFGQTLLGMFVSTYILYYYTDVLLLPAAAVSVLLLIVRLFDGVIDPLIGHYMDRRSFKNSKFKGYLIRWAPAFFLLSILLFTPFRLPGTPLFFVCFILYTLWSFVSSIMENVCGALAISLSADQAQRRQLNTFRIVASILATLIVTYLSLILVQQLGQGSEQKGFFYTTVLFTLLTALAICPSMKLIEERNYQPTSLLNLRQCLRVLLTHRVLRFFLLMYLSHQAASAFKTQIAIYYFKYAFERMDLVPTFFLLGRIASLSAQPMIVFFAKHFKILHLMMVGFIGSGLCMLAIIFTGSSVWGLIALASLGSVFSAFPANLAFTYSAEIVDQLSLGNNNSFSGIVVSLMGLSSKIGSSLAGSAVALVLALSAYVPNTAASKSSLFGIQVGFIGLTAALYLLSAHLAFQSYRTQNESGVNQSNDNQRTDS